MAFNADYSLSQGLDPTSFTLTDNSTGSDANLITRSISLYQADGSLLGGSVIPWPYSDGSTKNLTGYLARDRALNIVVDWLSSSPIPGSVYTKSAYYGFTGNTNNFIYGLIQDIAAQPSILNDTEFYTNLSKLQTEVDSCALAISFADLFNAQSALDRAYYIMVNQQFFF
jgi:hypothetical protein